MKQSPFCINDPQRGPFLRVHLQAGCFEQSLGYGSDHRRACHGTGFWFAVSETYFFKECGHGD